MIVSTCTNQYWRSCIYSHAKACFCLELWVSSRDYANCFESTLSSFKVKLKASYTVSEAHWTSIQEKLDQQTIHNWNFRKPYTCHAQNELRSYKTTKVCNLNFQNRVYVSFNKNKKRVLSDFYLAIHKLIRFCTRYLCIAVFSELVIIKYKNLDNLCRNYQVYPSY